MNRKQTTLQPTLQTAPQLFFPKFFILFTIFMSTGIALSFSLSYSFSIQQSQRIDGFLLNHAGLLALFFKQCIIAGIGIFGLYIILRTTTKFIRSASFLLCCLGIIFMIITAFWGSTINGARRWLHIGEISIQTGDFARVALLLYISHIFAQYHSKLTKVALIDSRKILDTRSKLIIRFFMMVSLYSGSLYMQRDYSSFLLSGVIILTIVMCSDLSFNLKLLGGIGLISFFVFIILSSPNRMERVVSFLNPSKDTFNTGFQLSQSYTLIREGGLFGKGVGSTMLDVLSLPYFYNDFVFSVIIAEFGLFGALIVLLLFMMFFYYSYMLCKVLCTYNKFYFYTVISCTTYILASAMGHVAVTVGLVPTAGLNMPFYSMGGSFMVTLILMCGFILKAALIADRRYLQIKSYSRNQTKTTLNTESQNFTNIDPTIVSVNNSHGDFKR